MRGHTNVLFVIRHFDMHQLPKCMKEGYTLGKNHTIALFVICNSPHRVKGGSMREKTMVILNLGENSLMPREPLGERLEAQLQVHIIAQNVTRSTRHQLS